MIDVAICIGHDRLSQGADPDGVGPEPAEWAVHGVVAGLVATALAESSYRVAVFERESGKYVDQMTRLIAAVNEAHPRAAIELHANSVTEHHPDRFATFGLYWPTSNKGRRLAAAVSTPVARALGTQYREPRPQMTSWAGAPLYFLRDTKMPACIIETHNVHHLDAHHRAIARPQELALAIALGLKNWLEAP